MSRSNADIRAEAKAAGVYLWQIAEKCGVTDAYFSRKLRHELPEKEKQKILGLIEELKGDAAYG